MRASVPFAFPASAAMFEEEVGESPELAVTLLRAVWGMVAG